MANKYGKGSPILSLIEPISCFHGLVEFNYTTRLDRILLYFDRSEQVGVVSLPYHADICMKDLTTNDELKKDEFKLIASVYERKKDKEPSTFSTIVFTSVEDGSSFDGNYYAGNAHSESIEELCTSTQFSDHEETVVLALYTRKQLISL